jgi:hypothetical protein
MGRKLTHRFLKPVTSYRLVSGRTPKGSENRDDGHPARVSPR